MILDVLSIIIYPQISSVRIEQQKRECTAHRLQAAVREDSVMVHGGRLHPRA